MPSVPRSKAVPHRRSRSPASSSNSSASMAKESALVAASKTKRFRLLACITLCLAVIMVVVACYYLLRVYPREHRVYSFGIVNEFHHDSSAFTQGLVYAGNDTLYESTGLYGHSTVRMVQLQTGEVKQSQQMEHTYFGEGLTLIDKRLFQLTWLTKMGFIYDKDTLALVGRFQHPMNDGWGLATDGESLVGSDGSETLYFMNSSTFAEQKRLIVKDKGRKIQLLNELEYVKDEIWANVWMSNCIARISPKNGEVLGWIILHDLLTKLLASGYKKFDVLNGIAWDEGQDRVFVTGKLWPKLYEIKVNHYPKVVDWESVGKVCMFSPRKI
eukprot:c20311_g1_i1 orf=575-1558(+)